jgi:type IV pilus biogenesis protein CpaD/CtpE
MKLVVVLTFCLLLAGCAARNSSDPAGGNNATGASSPDTSLPVGDAEERLEVAARLRRELRGEKAGVIVNGTKLVVTYRAASAEDAADQFIRQQGKAGMARIANAGFETLIVTAQDAGGGTQTKEVPVASYRTK